MKMVVNCINLPKRVDRLNHFKEQAKVQGFEYKIWEGVIDFAATFRAISNAHKQIVMYAKDKGLSSICICEDDILFTCANSWQYFLDNMPPSYDLYFASFYEGKVDGNNRLIKGDKSNELLSGLTLYSVHSRFYDTFININDMDHRDKQLGMLADQYEFYVTPEFCAIQMNGYSDNKKMDCNYDRYMVGRKLFGVNN